MVPSEHIDLNYFKILSQNLNDLFQFTFGNQIEKLLSNNENEINEMNSKFAAPYLSMSVAPYFILFYFVKQKHEKKLKDFLVQRK